MDEPISFVPSLGTLFPLPPYTFASVRSFSSPFSPRSFFHTSSCWSFFLVFLVSFVSRRRCVRPRARFFFVSPSKSNSGPIFRTWKASGLERDITGALSARTREPNRKPGSYLIRGEVYSPVDSNWARNHRALLCSFSTLKGLSLIHDFSRIIAGRAASPPPFVPLGRLLFLPR